MIYVAINNKNIITEVSETFKENMIAIADKNWPFEIYNKFGEYCYKLINDNIVQMSEQEIQSSMNSIDDIIESEEDEEIVHPEESIEQRVSAIENAFSILLDGV